MCAVSLIKEFMRTFVKIIERIDFDNLFTFASLLLVQMMILVLSFCIQPTTALEELSDRAEGLLNRDIKNQECVDTLRRLFAALHSALKLRDRRVQRVQLYI